MNWRLESLGNRSQGEMGKCGMELILLLQIFWSLREMNPTLNCILNLLEGEKDQFALS